MQTEAKKLDQPEKQGVGDQPLVRARVKRRRMRLFEGMDDSQEKALLYMIGHKKSWHDVLLEADQEIMDYVRAGGDLRHTSFLGLLMPYMAQAVAEGVEIGRRLERSPVIDTLYGVPCEPKDEA